MMLGIGWYLERRVLDLILCVTKNRLKFVHFFIFFLAKRGWLVIYPLLVTWDSSRELGAALILNALQHMTPTSLLHCFTCTLNEKRSKCPLCSLWKTRTGLLKSSFICLCYIWQASQQNLNAGSKQPTALESLGESVYLGNTIVRVWYRLSTWPVHKGVPTVSKGACRYAGTVLWHVVITVHHSRLD